VCCSYSVSWWCRVSRVSVTQIFDSAIDYRFALWGGVLVVHRSDVLLSSFWASFQRPAVLGA